MSESKITYDEFMPLPFEKRLKMFNKISAENRALMVRTQIERWLALNRNKLSEKQIELLKESIDFTTADKYEENRDIEKVQREALEVEKKMASVFSQDEMMQIMTIQAEYIPPDRKD